MTTLKDKIAKAIKTKGKIAKPSATERESVSTVVDAWNTLLPVVFWLPKEPIRVRLPYSDVNRALLKKFRGHEPVWDSDLHHWELPASRFEEICDLLLRKLGSFYLISPYDRGQECCSSCMDAVGYICVCGCMGRNHGINGGHGDRDAYREWVRDIASPDGGTYSLSLMVMPR